MKLAVREAISPAMVVTQREPNFTASISINRKSPQNPSRFCNFFYELFPDRPDQPDPALDRLHRLADMISDFLVVILYFRGGHHAKGRTVEIQEAQHPLNLLQGHEHRFRVYGMRVVASKSSPR